MVIAAKTLLQCVILSGQDDKETGRFLGSKRNVCLYSTNTEEESCLLCFPGQPTLPVISKDVPTSIITLAFKHSSSSLLGDIFLAAASAGGVCRAGGVCHAGHRLRLAAAPWLPSAGPASCRSSWPSRCTCHLPAAASGELISWQTPQHRALITLIRARRTALHSQAFSLGSHPSCPVPVGRGEVS